MSGLFVFLSVLFVIDSSLLVTVILLQKKHSKGASALGVTSSGSSNFMDRNKGRTKEGKLELYTKYLGMGYFLIALFMTFTF